jgi:hypothetical protein
MPHPEYLTLTDVTRYVQRRTGIKPGTVTVRNWMRNGKKSYSGNRVKLLYVKRLGRLYSCVKWVDKFLEDVNE